MNCLINIGTAPYPLSRKGRGGAVFRGRISVEGLEVEDLQDGTGIYAHVHML